MAEGVVADVVVIGGGLIGCAVAGELARRGLQVTVVEEREPGFGASGAAAGMLSPLSESSGPGAFLSLAVSSLALYDEFVAQLREATGIEIEYRRSGKLEVACDDEAEASLRRAYEWRRAGGHESVWLTGAEARSLEPALSSQVQAGLFNANDYQVENQQLTRAAWVAAARVGVRFRTNERVTGVEVAGGKVTGVTLASGGRLAAGCVVVAAGCWSGQLRGLPRPLPLKPIRGQIVVLERCPPPLSRVVTGGRCYIVPRAGGRVLIGATAEDAGFAVQTTGGGVHRLLGAALTLIPELADAAVVELRAGLRPGTPDGLPILGPDPQVSWLFYSTGHYRNGILLAPITARLLAEAITTGTTSTSLAPFAAERFDGVVAGAQG